MGSYHIDLEELQHTPECPAMVEASSSSTDVRRSPKRLWLTTKGVLALLKAGKLSLPSEDTIADRSESEFLAKTLVCLQTGYTIVQCVSRLASGLPLTFLEINTLSHVIYAFVMYSFCFHKPQDVNLSIPLKISVTKQLGNWHCFARDMFDIHEF